MSALRQPGAVADARAGAEETSARAGIRPGRGRVWRVSPWHRAVLVALACVVVAVMPNVATDNASMFKLITIVLWMSMGMAWNWVAGFAGRLDLGFGAYYATGAYASAYLMATRGWNSVLAIAAGAIVAMLFAALVGAAFLRLRGISYAIATLCVYLAVQQVPVMVPLLGAGAGLSIPGYVSYTTIWYAFGILALLGAVVSYGIRRSQFGLALLASREDELSADARGVNVAACRVVIYAAMGLMVGAVGGIWTLLNGFVSPPTVFASSVLLFVLVLALVGGIGTVLGPVIGAIVFTELGDYLWNRFLNYHDFILAIFLMVLALCAPHGLSAQSFRLAAGRVRAWRSRRAEHGSVADDVR